MDCICTTEVHEGRHARVVDSKACVMRKGQVGGERRGTSRAVLAQGQLQQEAKGIAGVTGHPGGQKESSWSCQEGEPPNHSMSPQQTQGRHRLDPGSKATLLHLPSGTKYMAKTGGRGQ